MKTGVFAPVYCFHGEEDFRKDAALRRLVEAAVDPAMRDFNCEVRRGAEVDAESLDLLLAAVGNDLQQLAAELDKLASYARGNAGGSGGEGAAVVDEEAVSAVVGVRRGETVGDLLDAVARRDAARAFGLVEHVLSQP